jgi:hypothetical protein
MADDKNKTGRQDRDRVNANEGYEVEQVHQKYPHLTHQQVKDAIRQHGPSREKIEAYLNGLKK